MKTKNQLNRTVLAGLSLGILGGFSETELCGQFSADYQTNIIATTVHWPGDYYVGSNYIGDVLEILPEGVLSNGIGMIGYLTGADENIAIVNGGVWTNSGTLQVGRSGTGNQLLVTNGGTVFSTLGYLGTLVSGSNNVVVVNGPGSMWRNSGTFLYLGLYGAGNQLVMTNGGQVLSGSSIIGRYESSGNNLAMVRGSGSVWSNNSITVGQNGQGNTVLVDDGGSVYSDNSGYIGFASSNNLVMVAGTGSVWSQQEGLYVGSDGMGNQLIVTNGGRVTANLGALGWNFGSNNVAIITGTGSVWSNTLQLYIGNNAPGNQLLITNGSTLFCDTGMVGRNNSSSNNFAVISGDGARWENQQNITVGFSASLNTLAIQTGGSVIASNAYVGFNASSVGNLLNIAGGGLYVTNAPSNGTLDIRRGTLNFDDGTIRVDRLIATNGAYSGVAFNGGTLIAHGASVSNIADFIIGDTGNHAAYVADGGIHVINDYPANDALVVGNSGSANQLIMTNGSAMFCYHGLLGVNASSSSNLAVISGIGSSWNSSGNLTVGIAGSENQLIVSDGGAMYNVFGGSVGSQPGSSNNMAIVTGPGSVWSNSSSLVIGLYGFGNELIVTNGGAVINGYAAIGRFSSTNNSVTVGGNGARWENHRLDIGSFGVSNSLNIATGGSVIASNAYVGVNASSFGNQINITDGALYVTNALGTGTLDIRCGTVIFNSGTLTVDKLVITNACARFIHAGGALLINDTLIIDPSMDADGDGMANGWEQSYGFDPLNPADADLDSDGDGQSNYAEFLTGTDPTTNASAFQIVSVATEGSDLRVNWTCGGGRTNVLQAAADPGGIWTDLSPDIVLTGAGDAVTNYLDVGAVTNALGRFYRVRLD